MKTFYMDPAGNITAIVCDYGDADRLEISKDILDKGLAEQVAFQTEPGRIEMMGGEFCGNAARAYGYLQAFALWDKGTHDVMVNISGAAEPVYVKVNLDAGESYAEMPAPLGIDNLAIGNESYPVVRMEGIDHMIVKSEPDEDFAAEAIKAMVDTFNSDACGVMFVEESKMTPVVHVVETESTVWESSCGSGSVAAAWYLAKGDTGSFTLQQPGGEIRVSINQLGEIMMGGKVSIIE